MAKPKIQPKIERGMRDFLPDVMRRRNWCMQQLRGVFESFGFEPLDTPAVESLAVLMGKYGEEGDRLIFKLHKGEGKESALRYDLTVPLARVVAMHQNAIALPWKRYHIAPVWRAERPQRGRFREFLQCDIDTVGAPAPVADAEVVAVAAAAYRALGLHPIAQSVKITTRIGHRKSPIAETYSRNLRSTHFSFGPFTLTLRIRMSRVRGAGGAPCQVHERAPLVPRVRPQPHTHVRLYVGIRNS